MGDEMAKKKQSESKVGFCKPPRGSQFKKGQSGNPGDRPKGSGSFAAAIRAQGAAIAPVQLDGKPAAMWEIVARRLFIDASKGSLKAIALLHQIEKAYGVEVPQTSEKFEYEVTLVLDEKPPVAYCAECGKALDDFIAAERAERNPTKH